MNLPQKLEYINSLEIGVPNQAELVAVVKGEKIFGVLYFKECDKKNYAPENIFCFPPESERQVIGLLQPLLDEDTPLHQGFDLRDKYYSTTGSCYKYPVIINPVVQYLQVIFGNWKEYSGQDVPDPCTSCRVKARSKSRSSIFTNALKKVLQ